MKKTVSLLLCVLTMSFMLMFAQNTVTMAQAEDFEKETAVLTYIGVLSGEIDYNKKVTRAEFVDYVAKFYGDFLIEDARYYKDVASDYWASDSINYLAELGLLSVGDDGMFYPERIISLTEACKIMLYASGYENLADFSGGYAEGVMKLAYENDIVPATVENPNELTVGDAIRIMFNGITIPTNEKQGTGYVVNTEDNLLRKYHDIFIDEGIVTAVCGASLTETEPLAENEVSIDYEECLLYEKVNPEKEFADYVEYIYREDDDEKTVIYLKRIENKNDDLVIESEQIEGFDKDSYTVSYYRENSSSAKKESFNRGIKVIYNGSVYDGSISKIFDDFIAKKARGTVKFKSYGVSEYDVMIVKSYRSIIVGYVNTDITTFHNAYDVADVIDIEEYDFVRVWDKNGNKAKLDGKVPQVISVSESEDKKYLEIVPSTELVSGKIEAIDDEYVTIKGTQYKVDPVIRDNVSIILGSEGNMHIDKFGYIVMMDVTKDGYNIGYLTKITYNPETEVTSFRIYASNATMNTYGAAKKIVIDSTSYDGNDVKAILGAIPDSTGMPGTFYTKNGDTLKINVARQAIRYKVNPDSLVTEIDTFYCSSKEDPKSTLTRDRDGSAASTYYHGPRSFAMDTMWSKGNSIVFSVPNVNDNGEVELGGRLVSDDAELYGTNFSFDHDQSYTIESYYYDPDNVYADIIVNRQASVYNDKYTYIVDDVKTVWLEDKEEVVYTFTGYQRGALKTFNVNQAVDIAGVKRGDVLKLYTNSSQTEILYFTKMYDAESNSYVNQTSNNDYWYVTNTGSQIPAGSYFRSSEFNLIKAYVDKIDSKSFLKLTYEIGQDEGLTTYGGYPIVIYDREADEIKVGSITDIKDYERHAGECSHILLGFQKAAIDYIYIFE